MSTWGTYDVRGAYLLEEWGASSRAERLGAKVLILGLEFTGFTCEEFILKECSSLRLLVLNTNHTPRYLFFVSNLRLFFASTSFEWSSSPVFKTNKQPWFDTNKSISAKVVFVFQQPTRKLDFAFHTARRAIYIPRKQVWRRLRYCEFVIRRVWLHGCSIW